MDNAVMKTSQKLLLKRYAWGLATGWTLVVGLLLTLNARHERQQAAETALTQARSDFQRDVIYRHWNAEYGPVYAPVGKGVAPNPYLAGTPDRDITTTKGKVLTLVNPAYMTRLVYELAARDYGVKGHITSLRPVRPENSPDAWEISALRTFERGTEEVSSVEHMEGAPYLRMMRPLRMGQECLKCHQKHGYQIGDIRGGISVAVPMGPLYRIAWENILMSAGSFTVLWLVGLGGVIAGAAKLLRTVEQRDRAEHEITALNRDLVTRKAELKAANRELEAFSFTVSHDLRSPLATVGGFCDLIRKLPAEKHLEKCSKYTGIIYQESQRMEKLIHTLLEFSRLSQVDVKREPVDLSTMAAEIAAGLRQSDPERSVTFRIEEGAEAKGDPALLRVVLQNLLGNAWKYTSKQREALIEFGVMKEGGEEIFFVRDNGAGFDREKAGRLFEAFHRLHSDKEFKGIGIGLATVKRIISRHAGRVWADGEVGKGATVYFTLP
jgi:signal transduction histidine kinase